MAYLSLYRKYRPQTFAEVIGQEHIVRTITNALNGGRVAHAYLFSGPRGTGKTTFARLLAKGLNCESGPTGTPCGTCRQCDRIARGYSVDVMEIDGASNRGIDEIRELRERVRFAPAEGRSKVYIIDEVHMLTNEAFNALLKVLEEPPAHVVFVFATTEAHKIPATILSRCQKFDFRRFNLAQTLILLERVAKAESVEAERAALVLVARQADGGMRDALAIFDQCLASDPGHLTVQTVVDVLGIVRRDALAQLTNHLLESDLTNALLLVNNLLAEGVEVRQLAKDLTLYARDILVLNVAPKASELVAVESRERSEMAERANKAGTIRLMQLVGALEGLDAELRWAGNPGLSLELALVRCIHQETVKDNTDLEKRLVALETELAKLRSQRVFPMAAPAPAPPQSRTPAPAPTPAPTPVSTSVEPRVAASADQASIDQDGTLAQLKQGWPTILGMLKEERMLQTEAFLREGVPVAVNGRTIVICFAPKHKFHQANMEQPRCKNAVERVISRFLGKEISIQTELGDIPVTSAAPAPKAQGAATSGVTLYTSEQAAASESEGTSPNQDDDVMQSPAVRKALQHLGGRIIGVQREEEPHR